MSPQGRPKGEYRSAKHEGALMSPQGRAGRRPAQAQRGVTMLVVLVLLTVMLMGGLSLARLTEVSTMATGNATFRDVGMQASEVGLNTAFAELRALPEANLDANQGNWYFATMQALDANGVPNVTWANAPSTQVGAYTVSGVVERMCGVTPVVNRMDDCLVRQIPQVGSRDPTQPRIDPPNVVQYRVTVRVVGPRGTESLVQSLMTRG